MIKLNVHFILFVLHNYEEALDAYKVGMSFFIFKKDFTCSWIGHKVHVGFRVLHVTTESVHVLRRVC